MMTSSLAQFEEVRRTAASRLSSSGSAQEIKTDIQALATTPLSLSEKYRHISAETMVMENGAGKTRQEGLDSLGRLVKALTILEKYGCNLASPCRPKYWRSVKQNNPVFRSTVDSVKGGRAVLHLYGYSNPQPDGLYFPDDVTEPDVGKVVAVTLEVMTLRLELDMFTKGTHSHPEVFEKILPARNDQEATEVEPELMTDAIVIPTTESQPLVPKPVHRSDARLNQPGTKNEKCNLCAGTPSLLCPSCGSIALCESCFLIHHRHPSRANHSREIIQVPKLETCVICGVPSISAHCTICGKKLCPECDKLSHSHPDRRCHNRTALATLESSSPSSLSLSTWECSQCTTVNKVHAVLCVSCERPRLATAAPAVQEDPAPPTSITDWQCKSCTVLNRASSILCEVCERPRLATRPPVTPINTPGLLTTSDTQAWTCQFCTYANSNRDPVCEMCNLPNADSPAASHKSLPSPVQPPIGEPVLPPVTPQVLPQVPPRVNADLKRQKLMKNEGRQLVTQIREAEKKGVSPEEVYAALRVASGSDVDPCAWLRSELPHLLDEICAMAASVQQSHKAEISGKEEVTRTEGEQLEQRESAPAAVQLSRAEAKRAWLAAGGDTEQAVRQLLRDRKAKVQELHSLGFKEVSKCEEALRLSGGEVRGALSFLQRPLLEPFHHRVWSDQAEVTINVHHPDKQQMCRRLLALYELPSWGRCELALSLLQEPEAQYSLEDVIQAVRESQDRDFIRRVLSNECPCCLDKYPRSKMQSLTSCQCSVCRDCFQQHFTIAVRDRHIRDMVCPACGEPDINDPEHLNSYFSTLDIQLRSCLEAEVYELFHKKLMEHALIKDPKFLWCCHCTYGFIYDGDQPKVTCPSCQKSFCAHCKKPWEPQHLGLSCEQFQAWKRENDPEYQKQGLAGYLRDNGIVCPSCRFQYALTKGGCMHFICSQCRYQFCSGCNNPYHTTACAFAQCNFTGLHAHHPRDCLFYLRDWAPARLQALLQKNAVEFNTDLPNGSQAEACGVMEQKEEGGRQLDLPCGAQALPGHAGLCDKHYREYLVSLINGHALDPATLYDEQEVVTACRRYQVEEQRGEDEDPKVHHARLLKALMEVPLGVKVPRKK